MHLSILLIPNAHQNEIVGWHEGALKVRISAPPIEGRANKMLIDFLAETFNLAPSEIEIEKGVASKYKRVSMPVTKEDVEALLRS